MIYFLVLLCGLIVLFFALTQYQKSSAMIKQGETAQAKVVEMITSPGRKSYKPVFEFVTKSNELIRFEHEIGSKPAAWEIGEETAVIYHPLNPRQVKVVGYWGLFRPTIILIAIASPLIIIGGGYFLYIFTFNNLLTNGK